MLQVLVPGDLKEYVHDVGVKLAPPAPLQLKRGGGEVHAAAVLAVGGHGVKGIRHT